MLRFAGQEAKTLEARINILPPLNSHFSIETESGEQLTDVQAVTLEGLSPETITIIGRASHRQIAHALLEMTDNVPALLPDGSTQMGVYELSSSWPTLASAEVPIEGAQNPDARRIVAVRSMAVIATAAAQQKTAKKDAVTAAV